MNVAVHSQSLDILSLCTGGGGLDLGVELAIPCARSVVMVEREAFAVAHLVAAMEQGLMAQAAVWSDARTFDGRPWRGLVDGLIGGIPCQPHSLAGRKRGQLDGRDLWSDARRIIATSRPWFVLIENVSGMLAAGDDEIAGAERVWRDLRKLGFAVEGGLFTAAEVGASHERERIFILAVADTGRSERRAIDRSGRVAHWHEAGWNQGASRASEPSISLADASGKRGTVRISGPIGLDQEGAAGELIDRRHAVADADILELRGQPSAGEQPLLQRDDAAGAGYLFPPGPNDSENWQAALERAPELEPAFRRVADGMASRLDIARVDRLRLLGNGVVPLEAAYALRTLVTRLAARGSAGAIELAGMMAA